MVPLDEIQSLFERFFCLDEITELELVQSDLNRGRELLDLGARARGNGGERRDLREQRALIVAREPSDGAFGVQPSVQRGIVSGVIASNRIELRFRRGRVAGVREGVRSTETRA